MASRRAAALLALAYLGSRLVALRVLPVFVDEAKDILWAGRLVAEGRIDRPWVYGRALEVVAIAPFVRIAPDPVLAARLVSVLLCGACAWAAAFLAREAAGPQAGLLAALAYVACPYALFYDRLALADTVLAAINGIALAAAVLLVAAPSRRRAA